MVRESSKRTQALRQAKRDAVETGTDQPNPNRAANRALVERATADNPDEIHPHALRVLGGEAESTRINTGEHLPQSTPPLLFGGENFTDPTIEERRNTIFQLWLKGYDTVTIARKIQMGYNPLRKEIKIIREKLSTYIRENPQVFGGPIEALYLQIVRRRQRQSAIWEEIEGDEGPRKPAYFRLIAEEDKAIEGLLGMDRRTLDISVGSPMEQAQADLLRKMGPDELKELLEELRRVHPLVADGKSIQTIDITPTSAGQVLR